MRGDITPCHLYAAAHARADAGPLASALATAPICAYFRLQEVRHVERSTLLLYRLFASLPQDSIIARSSWAAITRYYLLMLSHKMPSINLSATRQMMIFWHASDAAPPIFVRLEKMMSLMMMLSCDDAAAASPPPRERRSSFLLPCASARCILKSFTIAPCTPTIISIDSMYDYKQKHRSELYSGATRAKYMYRS